MTTESACLVVRALEAMQALASLVDHPSAAAASLLLPCDEHFWRRFEAAPTDVPPEVITVATTVVEGARARQFMRSLLEWPQLLETTRA